MSEHESAPETSGQSGEEALPVPQAPANQGEQGGVGGLMQFVTPLRTIEQQVGSHTITALQHPQTVAVLSTVAMGQDGTQRIVSIGLDPQMLGQVEQLLHSATEQQKRRVPCIGFHCYIDKPEDGDDDEETTPDA